MEVQVYSDDARRMADAVTLHALAGDAGRWCVIALADGREYGFRDAYDNRYDAVASTNWNRDNYCYLFIPPDGMQPKEAEAFLRYTRALHDAGFRLPDPDSDCFPDLTMPLLAADRKRQIRLLTKGN